MRRKNIDNKNTTINASKTLRLAIAQRGQRLHNLWWLWSPKCKKFLTLPSDAALAHAALQEGDPDVIRYELEAPSYITQVAGITTGTRYDSTVYLTDGSKCWDEVKAEENAAAINDTEQIKAQRLIAQEHGTTYRLFTQKELKPKLNRIWNILRGLQCIAAAQRFQMSASNTVILAHLNAGPSTIGKVRLLGDGDEGINLAALFSLLFRGDVVTDLDSQAIDDESVVVLKDRDHA